MAKLKVFVVPTGFHDAYVAAPSRKAALAAWGSTHDLFARGVASEVIDPALMAEPLARPGEVIKRSRGTTAEQIAALPPNVAQAADEASAEAKPRKAAAKAKPRPKPSREALEAAETALAEATRKHRAEDADFAKRQAELDRERRQAKAAGEREQAALDEAVQAERDRYDRAMARWRAD